MSISDQNKSTITSRVVDYYMYPERFSYDEKAVLHEAIQKDRSIHYNALKIIHNKDKKARKRTG